MSAPELLFFACALSVGYHYAGYPLVLFLLSLLAQAKSDLLYLLNRKSRRATVATEFLPRVAVLMSAYNEAAVIQAKVKNCLEIDYPSDRLEFLFGLDASGDATADLLAQMQSVRIQVFRFNTRRGKLGVLTDLAQRTNAEIVIFTDANTMLKSICIRNMARHFADPEVGAVSGEEIRTAGAGTDPGAESIYWRYESAIKVLESRLNCSLGGNGGVLAVRRSLFQPRHQSIVEDFQIPLEIRYKGFRVVYDPEAIAVEEITPAFRSQFARRVRIGAGNYEVLFRNPAYLDPRKGLLAFCFISHRLLRWLVPLLLVNAFICNAALIRQAGFAVLFAAQLAFYSMAITGYWLKRRGRTMRILSVPLHFCSMNLALLFGFAAYLRGRQGLVWDSTPRLAQSELKVESLLAEPARAVAGMNDALDRFAA